jgi:hypothetical protein
VTRALVGGGNRRGGTRRRLTPVGTRRSRACHESLAPQGGTTTLDGAQAHLQTAPADRRRAGKFLDAIAVEPLTPLRQIDEGKGD